MTTMMQIVLVLVFNRDRRVVGGDLSNTVRTHTTCSLWWGDGRLSVPGWRERENADRRLVVAIADL